MIVEYDIDSYVEYVFDNFGCFVMYIVPWRREYT